MTQKPLASILKTCVCSLLALSVAAHETLNLDKPGFEALLLRNPTTRECEISYARDANLHKALRHTSIHVEIKPARCARGSNGSCGADHVLVVGQTKTDVLGEIEKQCSATSGELDLLGNFLDVNHNSEVVLFGSRAPTLEIHPLPGLLSGSTSNRVNIVFFSDGYTAGEKSKFLSDASRLALDITVNQTYAPVAQLLNFWGAFTPSEESGIGVGGKPKNTVYGLYRDGTELRGVYTSKPKVARAACKSMGRQCNYPLLLGNDPLYGGLGGEFTISTASVLNGPLVLRHELGHSIIWVGDEYDGSAYFGVNAAKELAPKHDISWAHWLSDPPAPNTPPRAERNAVPLLAYPWTMLNRTAPWSTTFSTSGTFDSAVLRFSLSGVPDSIDLVISLDNREVKWEANEKVQLDRWFYDVPLPELSQGQHELRFKLQESGKEGLAQLCSVEVIEYGAPNEFNSTEGFVGAFPTYSPEVYEDPDPEPDRFANHSHNDASPESDHDHATLEKDWPTVSYRPTNEGCLMRQVAMPDFCVVCTEGLWLRLLARVSLIDKISVVSTADAARAGKQLGGEFNSGWTVELSLIRLAHLRSSTDAAYLARKGVKESYLIRWFEEGKEVEAWQNLTWVGVECGKTLDVEVRFMSTEIRKDEKGYAMDKRRMVIGCEGR